MVLETNVAARWIVARLKASVALTNLVGDRISDWPAPQGQSGPYVVFQMQSALDTYLVGNHRTFMNATYLVWGGMQTRSYAGQLGQVADAIDTALHDQSGTVAGGLVVACRRERIEMQVDPDEPSWRFYGGLYRVLAQVT